MGTGNTGASKQGQSVSLSADGNTAVVGGHEDDTNIGAVWVYTRTAGAWAQQGAKLVGTGATGAINQGHSVAVSADGNTFIEGGYNDNGNVGAIWIYTRTAGAWTQQGAKFSGTGYVVGAVLQGYASAMSADASTVMVGGYADDGFIGATWFFTP